MDIKCLLEIKNDLKNYHRNKTELILYYINERLNKSFMSYYNELNDSYNFIETKDNLEILKNLKD